MPSAFGSSRGLRCPGCGLGYDDFRCGWQFKTSRREIIAIKVDRKTGKTKYGRRSGTLGWMHEQKMLYWDQHVGECSDAFEAAQAADELDGGSRVAELRRFAAERLAEQRDLERSQRSRMAKRRRQMIRAGTWQRRRGQPPLGPMRRAAPRAREGSRCASR
jgi:hypothetical protein